MEEIKNYCNERLNELRSLSKELDMICRII